MRVSAKRAELNLSGRAGTATVISRYADGDRGMAASLVLVYQAGTGPSAAPYSGRLGKDFIVLERTLLFGYNPVTG
jgi:hypothetical protein